MRIHHFIAPARVGGAETVVRSLTAGLRERGHDVRVSPILPEEPESHPFVRSLEASDVPVTPVVVGDRAYVAEWREVKEVLRRRSPQVVHTHGHRSDLLDAEVARRLGIPTVTTVHGFTASTSRTRLYRRLQRWAFRRFDGVVAVSGALAAELAEAGTPRDRIHVVPNAWDGDDERLEGTEARRLLGVPEDVFHVGWVGRLGTEKGPDVLLRALSRLDEVHLVASVIGVGAEAGRLREQARRLDLGERLRWHGELPRARRLLPAFDCLVLSSRREGTPMVLLEGMAAGVPVVSTRVGGVPDVVSDAEALLVPPEDPAALAGAIRDVRDDPEAARCRAVRARSRLEVERGRAAWIGRHERLYRSVLSSSDSKEFS